MPPEDLFDSLGRAKNSIPFNEQLKHVDEDWRTPIVEVVDTFSTVKLGLDGLAIFDTLALIEAVKLVINRRDKFVAAEAELWTRMQKGLA